MKKYHYDSDGDGTPEEYTADELREMGQDPRTGVEKFVGWGNRTKSTVGNHKLRLGF